MFFEDNLVRPETPVNEGTTALVQVTFVDETGASVVPTSAVYTLYDRVTGQVINSRTAVAVPGSGAVRTIELTPADNPVLNQMRRTEEHRLYIEYNYGAGGAKTGSVEVQILVTNMRKKP